MAARLERIARIGRIGQIIESALVCRYNGVPQMIRRANPKPRDKIKQPKRAAPAEIRRLLPQLSAQEAQELKLLLGSLVTPATSDWLLAGVQGELRRRGLGCQPLTTTFVNKWAPNALAEAATVREVLATSERRGIVRLSSRQWEALGRVCVEALARYLTEGPKPPPLSANVLLRNISKVPQALDADFPGYLESGLLLLLVPVRGSTPNEVEAAKAAATPYEDPSEARYRRDERYLARRRAEAAQDAEKTPFKRTKLADGDFDDQDSYMREVQKQEANKARGAEAAEAEETKAELADGDFNDEDGYMREFEKQEANKARGVEAAEAAENPSKRSKRAKLADGGFDDEDSYMREVEKQERNKALGAEARHCARDSEAAADEGN